MVDARRWFPISFLLVLVIYTGSKSLVRSSLALALDAGLMDSRAAILEHPSVHHLQEHDHHLDRVWRSRLVWRKCHGAESRLVRSHGEYERASSGERD